MNAASGAIETAPAIGPANDQTPLRVGTRGSPLALVQTRHFIRLLREAFPGASDRVQEEIITTTGDAVQDRPLADIGGKGLFAKEIHEALADGRVDFAVHSLKDLETELPRGIILACTLPREDPRDALILSERCGEPDPSDPLAALPHGAVVGTSSVRRQAQLLAARPDLRVVPLRGNVQTRLGKLRDGLCDATLLALAGLNRLRLSPDRMIVLDPEVMLPAACQGIVGITVRATDQQARAMLASLDDSVSRAAATAERALLAELDGSCRAPIGGYARLQPDGRLLLSGSVGRADGTFLLRRDLTGRPADADRIGQTLGTSLMVDAPADIFD